jgi:peptidoglycan/LPS O-acetylase OafA/YrhL
MNHTKLNDSSQRNDDVAGKRLAWLDQVRGVAICMVVAVHCSQGLSGVSSVLRLLAEFGQFGVQLFFVASAYTLCLTYYPRYSEKHSVAKFFVRRFFRIAPLYYCAIAGYALWHFLTQMRLGFDLPLRAYPYDVLGILTNMSFTHSLVREYNNNVVPGGWSIGVEMFFYVLFPIVFLIFEKTYVRLSLRGVVAFGLALCTLSAALVNLLYGAVQIQNNSFEYFGLPNQFPVFVVGIVLYYLVERSEMPKSTKWIAFFICAVASCASVWLWFGEFVSGFAILPLAVSLPCASAMYLIKTKAQLLSTVLARIGQCSYAMYLCHWLFAYALGVLQRKYFLDTNANLLLAVGYLLVLLISFVFSSTVLASIEAGGISLGKRIIEKLPNRCHTSQLSGRF